MISLRVICQLHSVKQKNFIALSCRFYSKIRSHDDIVQKYLNRQISDPFCKNARLLNYRARSAFKLIELNEKFRIVKKGDIILDAGAAPGSWCQVLREAIFSQKNPDYSCGFVLGVDLQPMAPLEHVEIISPGDITSSSTQAEIKRRLNGRFLDAVFSDMAPNPTGNASNDHLRIIRLCRTLFLLFSPDEAGALPLKQGGKFLCKIWDGSSKKKFVDELSDSFKHVHVTKPKASRENSAETYILASGYKLL